MHALSRGELQTEVIRFPLWGEWRAAPREVAFPFRVRCRLLPTKEVIAFPFGEGVGSADGRGLYGGKCPPSAELNESKNKKVRALC